MFTVTSPRFARPRFLTAFWLVCLCLWLPALALAQTSVAPTIGDGLTTTTAYQITSLQNLAWLQTQAAASATSGVYFALANNIDATSTTYTDYNGGSGFLPIGTYSLPFQGTFLGNGHTISNLTITRSSLEQVGLFGAVESGTLQDLSLTGVAITGRNYVGGLVGTLKANTAFYNCSVSGTVSGGTSIGGLAGESPLSYASIIQCSAAVNVTGSSDNAGGLIGYLRIASGSGGTQTISQCSSTGAVSGNKYVGGLIGYAWNYSTQTISQCYATGAVTGSGTYSSGSESSGDYVGGLVGKAYNYGTQTISQCYATGAVTADDYVGGLAGHAYNHGTQTISECYATGDTTGNCYVAGLAGYAENYATQTISQCYASGDVTMQYSVAGGLLGFATSDNYLPAGATQTIAQCYASGKVSGATDAMNIGGLVGKTSMNAEYGTQTFLLCHASGEVSGTINVGGLVGYAYTSTKSGALTISQCYASGDVSGTERVGGLVGKAYNDETGCSQTIELCYATGNATAGNNTSGASFVGGLVGYAYNYLGSQEISLCYATGNATGSGYYVGGLVGQANNSGTEQTISQCYATGVVTGSSDYVGGLVGYAVNSGTQTFTDCYCLSSVYGAVDSGDQDGVSVVSASVLRTQSTYSNWDFPDDWVIDTTQGLNDGYPYLRCFSALVYSLNINDGATTTSARTVTLQAAMTPFATHYAVSENADFSGTSWAAYDPNAAITYTLSCALEKKTIYFVVCNGSGSLLEDVSDVTSATITLAGVKPTVTAFTISSGGTSTESTAVTIQNTATGDPTYYRVSESASGVHTAAAQTYASSGLFTLSSGNGTKTVYFKVGNETGESNVMSASISLEAADMAFVKNSVVVQSAHTESYVKKTTSITSKDTYAFKASVQLPSTFSSISATTQINITVGDITFSDTISNAVSKSLKGAKGGSAVFRTQVLVGKIKKTTQIITLTWSKTGLLKIVVTGTPIAATGSAVTSNVLNALTVDDGSIAANVPIEVGVGTDYARNTTGVVCTGTRTTSTVKNTSVNLNKWVMTGKK